MPKYIIGFFILLLTGGMFAQQNFTGYFNFSYDDSTGVLMLEVPESSLGEEFLYVNSLSAGVGSNDIGLDRGQLGRSRVVKFIKAGSKLLLVQPNQNFRAESDNLLEKRAVEEAFAQSVIWGFKIKDSNNGSYRVDMTGFLLRDSHGVVGRLRSSNQGAYKLDVSRSAVWMDRTRSFPKNSEFDALLTFTGDPKGGWIRSVTPSPDAVTVRQHHSFIELPDDEYQPREFHPYSGFNQMSYFDYATPIDQPIMKRFIRRHRLEKKNPGAEISEAKEPIIYYLDPGCPEPISSALIEGASWWDQAFQAAGYAPGTFQVKVLPADADMLDVRYNVIQWVHRSTRGWSYGSSVSDPRTGEILKGHVSLGSLRVRQDFLIAQALLSPYGDNQDDIERMKGLALARLRQLSAHEVGHTIGLSHNFASSYNDRASVMDYPHPFVTETDGNIGFDQAYEVGIGDWDKVTVTYGYQDFPSGVDEKMALTSLVNEAQREGFLFISDSDSRPVAGAHPHAHLWDNGEDAVSEFNRLLDVRRSAIERFGEESIMSGTPLSELEKVLVPLYLLHRYQLEAVSKLIGGVNYQYFVKGDAYDHNISAVNKEVQGRAVQAILHSLSSEELKLPESITTLIPPPAQGYRRGRETFSGRTHLAFDAMAPVESYTNTAMRFLLNPERLARIHRQNITNQSEIELSSFLNQLATHLFSKQAMTSYDGAIDQLVQQVFFTHLLNLGYDKSVDGQVAATVHQILNEIESKYLSGANALNDAHLQYLRHLHRQASAHPGDFNVPRLNDLPPGSPIGCGDTWLGQQ